MDTLICLDLEGTLISNAVSQIPRPGLKEFLSELSTFAGIVLFTSVSPQRTQEIKRLLVEEGSAPDWFLRVQSIHPAATVKYKASVSDAAYYRTVLLVDDQSSVIAADEHDWWVPVAEYMAPYEPEDCELEDVFLRIRERLE